MINLLPKEIIIERQYGRRNRTLLGYSFSLLVTALATAAIMLGSLQFVGADESTLKQEIANAATDISVLEKQTKSIESVANRLLIAQQVSLTAISFSDLLPQIGAVLPKGVVLNALSLTGGVTDPLQLDVDLTSADLAPILIRNLVESNLFEAADISSLSPKGVSDTSTETEQSQYRFTASLTASFKGTAEAKRKEAATAAAKAAADAAAAEKDAGSQ